MSDAVHSTVLVVAAMCAFIVAFSMSWAGVFWVLMSEIFSMPVKSPAVAAATAALFLVGATLPSPRLFHHCPGYPAQRTLCSDCPRGRERGRPHLLAGCHLADMMFLKIREHYTGMRLQHRFETYPPSFISIFEYQDGRAASFSRCRMWKPTAFVGIALRIRWRVQVTAYLRRPTPRAINRWERTAAEMEGHLGLTA